MDALVTTALIGTAQHDGEVTTGAPVDELLVRRDSSEAERRLLLQAGALAIYRAAGATPIHGVPALEPAPEEKLPACSPSAAAWIRSFLSGTHTELLPEALERLRLAGLRLPFDLLPLALSAREHRDALALVLGERGRWLSAFNPSWTWARGAGVEHADALPDDVETIWQEGTASERVAVLRRVRANDPAQAREWLAAVWKREKAEMRADLLGTLEIGLTTADESFLEAALDDRGGAVRERAALLLARLPESALARRMAARADSVLGYAGGTLTVKPPKEFEKAGVRDGLVEKPPTGTGQKAWWIAQYLSRVSLTHWNECFGVPPEDLVTAAVAHTDWKWPVLEGWSRAFLLHGDTSWIIPLWQAWSEPAKKGSRRQSGGYDDIREALAPHVPKEELERLAHALLSGQRNDFPMSVSEILSALPQPWSGDLGAVYLSGLLAFVASLTAKSTEFEPWGDTLAVAALGLPPECYSLAVGPFTVPDGNSWRLHQFQQQLDEFAGAIQWRQHVMEEIPL